MHWQLINFMPFVIVLLKQIRIYIGYVVNSFQKYIKGH